MLTSVASANSGDGGEGEGTEDMVRRKGFAERGAGGVAGIEEASSLVLYP